MLVIIDWYTQRAMMDDIYHEIARFEINSFSVLFKELSKISPFSGMIRVLSEAGTVRRRQLRSPFTLRRPSLAAIRWLFARRGGRYATAPDVILERSLRTGTCLSDNLETNGANHAKCPASRCFAFPDEKKNERGDGHSWRALALFLGGRFSKTVLAWNNGALFLNDSRFFNNTVNKSDCFVRRTPGG